MYTATAIITNFKLTQKSEYMVQLKTELTYPINVESSDKNQDCYNCFFNIGQENGKLLPTTHSFRINNNAWIPFIVSIATSHSKAIFEIDKDGTEILSVEINNAK